MDTDLYRAVSLIGRNGTLRIPYTSGRTLLCASGQVRITHGDTRDVILGSGESFTLDRPGEAIVQAIGTSAAVVMLDDPAAGQPIRRQYPPPVSAPTDAIDRFAAALRRGGGSLRDRLLAAVAGGRTS